MLFVCDNCGTEDVQQDEKRYVCQACGAVYPLGYPIAKINSQIIDLAIDSLKNYLQTCSPNLKLPVEEAVRALEHTNLATLSRCADRLIALDDSCEIGWMLKSMLSLWNTTYYNLQPYNEAIDYAIRAIKCSEEETGNLIKSIFHYLMRIVSYATKVELLDADMPVPDKMDRYGELCNLFIDGIMRVLAEGLPEDILYSDEATDDAVKTASPPFGLSPNGYEIAVLEKTMELHTAIDMWNQIVHEAGSMSDTQIIISFLNAYHMTHFASICSSENFDKVPMEYLYTIKAAREESVSMVNEIIRILEEAGLSGGADIFREPLRNDESNLAEIEAVIAEREAQEEI